MQETLRNPKVIIIIPNWNGSKDRTACVESVKNIDYPNFEILIVDNGSTDDSRSLQNEIPKYNNDRKQEKSWFY
ncbi:glycosyltransferase [Candidatus Bathyarchaeota archaeon]|jgi:hypothetical protein|nr:glycosyltransferase [Candidatus Bathyarchaeota archaeon]